MQHLSDWSFNIVFFSSVLGFLVSGILVFISRNDTFPSRLLAAFLTCFSLLCLNYGLMVTSFYLRYPHLWRVFGWASFSFAPFCYLYVRSVLEQSYKFKRWDFLLFIPALIHPLNLVPFYIKPASEKIAFLTKVLADQKMVTLEPEGLLPDGVTLYLRILLGLACITGQIILLVRWKNRIMNSEKPSRQNRETYTWLVYLTSAMAIFWAMIIIGFVINSHHGPGLNTAFIFTIAGVILLVSFSLLLRPSILYGLTGWLQEPEYPLPSEQPAESAPPVVSVKKNTLSLEQGKAYREALETHFRENQPFRKAGYTIAELSREMNIPSYQVSGFINQQYGKNFNELINEFRVDYLEELLNTSPEYYQYTFEALGKIAGFNSRAAFIAAVKKRTGKTPSEFFGKRSDPLITDIVSSS